VTSKAREHDPLEQAGLGLAFSISVEDRPRQHSNWRSCSTLWGGLATRTTEPLPSRQQLGLIQALISSGAEKITDARSPTIPVPMMAGAPWTGPMPLVSVLKRRLRSQ
jgi:hypothetical protein